MTSVAESRPITAELMAAPVDFTLPEIMGTLVVRPTVGMVAEGNLDLSTVTAEMSFKETVKIGTRSLLKEFRRHNIEFASAILACKSEDDVRAYLNTEAFVALDARTDRVGAAIALREDYVPMRGQ